MLKIEMNGKDCRIEFKGSIRDAVNHTANIVRSMYERYREDEPVMAELFKIGVTLLIGDDNSPVWKDEEEKDGIKSVEINLPEGFKMPGDE